MKTVITTNGLNIIGQNSGETTAKYWIGYFGLAYVPDELREEGQPEELKAGMTQLTVNGDNIYNLFQGSMKPEGLNTDIGDSAANKLYNECMYTANVMSRYRYVMDENETNHLVVFKSYVDPVTGEEGVKEYCTFDGCVDQDSSELPIPAPLYYLGEPMDYSDIQLPVFPNVSCDTRTYTASDTTNPGPGFDSESWVNDNRFGWATSLGNTYDEDGNVKELENAWQVQSVSNYNRFHAPANSAGYAVGYDPACRNMAKATKFFPIGHYDILSTKNDEKVAKVQYTVDINMKSVFTEVSNRSTRYFDSTGAQVTSGDYKMSFKFNRVGIYAVPVALHAYTDSGENQDACTNYNVQMQITGNSEPLLFAVMDLDSPVIMSEDGCLDYQMKFNVDYKTDSDAVDSTSIFYNLYEDDAITWYKNQLIANASAANAITTMGVQLSYLRKQVNSVMPGSTTGCVINDRGSNAMYFNKTGGLKNLKDAGSLSIANADSITTSITRSMWWGDDSTLFNLPSGETSTNSKVSDSLVFLGKYGKSYGDVFESHIQTQFGSDWLGIGHDMNYIDHELKESGDISENASMFQPSRAPMIYTGGIALGGRGNVNYGLIKLGSRIKHVSTQSELYNSDTDDIISVSRVYSSDAIHLIPDGEDHFLVHSPHAGKVLTVLDEQELDGTLHIGLKPVGSIMKKQVSIQTSYISDIKSHRITISTVTLGGTMVTRDIDITHESSINITDATSGIQIIARQTATEDSIDDISVSIYAHPTCPTYYSFATNKDWFTGVNLCDTEGHQTDTIMFGIDGATNSNNICYLSMLAVQAFKLRVVAAGIEARGPGPGFDYMHLAVDTQDIYTYPKATDNTSIRLVPIIVPDFDTEGVAVTIGLNGQGYDINFTDGTYPYTWFMSNTSE